MDAFFEGSKYIRFFDHVSLLLYFLYNNEIFNNFSISDLKIGCESIPYYDFGVL